ncbi:hypothetical protein CFN78_01525 [Amycolatopsis antarctica]|uniref:Uncharacterized protein n=1 Tax=Amycolatopsis antarctica TaxID=1854586 RepID=A0A263D8T9_9PSEU|nr:hypothetical protein [Amycolatopsis antarctica]OZM74922.1 hypothetical protein CFN78_01525 [Amycolatopsis antarctica]
MSAEGRLAAAREALAAVSREEHEQRGLRERRLAEVRAATATGLEADALRAAERIEEEKEVQRRAEASGGWVTDSTYAKKDAEDSFGFEEDDGSAEEPPPAGPPSPFPPPSPHPVHDPPAEPAPERPQARHARRAAVDDEDFAHTDWTAD